MYPEGNFPATPAGHFRLSLYGVIAHLIDAMLSGGASLETLLERHPFLVDYVDVIGVELGAPPEEELAVAWSARLALWESNVERFMPLRAMRTSGGLTEQDVALLICCGLVEEDGRFGGVFEEQQGLASQRRPTVSLLMAWWRDGGDCDGVRASLQHLIALGLIEVVNPDAPRMDWALSVPSPFWDALRGVPHPLPWLTFIQHGELAPLEHYLAPRGEDHRLAALPPALIAEPAQSVIVRGPQHNGRKSLVKGLVHALGHNALVVHDLEPDAVARWRLTGALATALDAVPIVEVDCVPGELRVLPALPCYTGPLAIIAGRHGGFAGPRADGAITIELDLPDRAQRAAHWRAGLRGASSTEAGQCVADMRLTSGNIRRAARRAQSSAAMGGRPTISREDIVTSCRQLHAGRLEVMATRLPATGTWAELAVDTETECELRMLEARCRFREALAEQFGGHADPARSGVRALFSGASGTGKTLAARLLAAELGKDLYRIDLAGTVNKYIGETEKNLNRVFGLAEELDIVLLVDEGDALLTQRTDVQTSNDRYANLETNFLLQRIETFEGILLVTTNAVDRIDKAFQRRMDVVIPFRAPDVPRRYAILRQHLPTQHAVDDEFLQDVAQRCVLTGGQIRNVASHALLLALERGRALDTALLEMALQREYRKAGAMCPLKRSPSLAVVG